MNYYKIFYWLVVADNAKSFFWFFAIVFSLISTISTFAYFFNIPTEVSYGTSKRTESDIENQRIARKWMWWAYPFMILFWFGIIFTPSKKDSLLIVAGGGTLNYLTTDSSSKQIPKELSRFLLTEIKNMAKESEIELNVQDSKQKIIEEAKNMTASDLLNKINSDSTFRKILLSK